MAGVKYLPSWFQQFISWSLQSARIGHDDAREPNHPVEDEPEEIIIPPTDNVKKIKTVGAWVGSSTLKYPGRGVDFAIEHGINRFDIVINDHSKWRKPTPFTVRSSSKIARLAKMANEAGIEVHLMSWIMPHSVYIESASRELIPLAKEIGAKSIQWDAEEPWMKAVQAMPYDQAARLIQECFKSRNCQMGVNGIGYASVNKLKPLAAVCDYAVPQAYSTSNNNLDPKKAPITFYNRWSSKFQRPIVMGLAAYRQRGIPGYNPRQAILAAVEAVRSTREIDTIIYWSLRHIRKNTEVADAISTILNSDKVA